MKNETLKQVKEIDLNNSTNTKNTFTIGSEAITLALAFTIYSLWLLLTFNHSSIPYPLLFILGGLTVCWHGSLQHETIHGHPFKKEYLNSILAFFPLGIIIPYPIYKELHRKHHQTKNITDPFEDPESFYITQSDWTKLNSLSKTIYRFNNTLLGRLLTGPFVTTFQFLKSEIKMILDGNLNHLSHWLLHGLAISILSFWVVTICGISPLSYLLFFVYPGMSLTLLRSFREHRIGVDNQEKSAIIKSNAFFQLLYLNNNFHWVHHNKPGLAWYKIPKTYFGNKNVILAANGGYYLDGYGELFNSYLLKEKDSPLYPEP